MKVLIVLAAVLLATVNADEEWKVKSLEEVRAIKAECLKEHPLTEEHLEKLKTYHYANEEDVRKYLVCVFEKMGVFCHDKGFHLEHLVQQLKLDMDEAEAREAISKCLETTEEHKIDDNWAYTVHSCILNTKVGENLKEYVKKKVEEEHAATDAAAAEEAAS